MLLDVNRYLLEGCHSAHTMKSVCIHTIWDCTHAWWFKDTKEPAYITMSLRDVQQTLQQVFIVDASQRSLSLEKQSIGNIPSWHFASTAVLRPVPVACIRVYLAFRGSDTIDTDMRSKSMITWNMCYFYG